MQNTLKRMAEDSITNNGIIEGLIELLQLSNETSLTNLVFDFNSFKTLFMSISSPTINNFFQNHSMIKNKSTTAIKTFKLDTNIDRVVFVSPSSLLSEEVIKDKFNRVLEITKTNSLMKCTKVLL